ncbi:SDR family oxidoreductase [Dactylosporangium sp. AC04546]|uniref:SDR family oxidoreductase n=1 Tax=Dactylosporangium sp. AC04546 TaxID=2862460 RepID=UPI001EE04CAA|nr:SDR family oxidoreductase [Dactylosporangium sp. AC04546]WVK81050.1 SDR family oxidoreductase [Dactylosporangium sp. AC04546]
MTVFQAFSLTGRTAIVTGGTGLYGTPIARTLAEAGAHVVITSRSAARAEAAASVLRAAGLAASGVALDLSDPASIAGLPARLDSGVDILVNNAVHRQGGDLFATSAADWDATSAANSRGLFLVTQTVAAAMIERGTGGAILNIGSIYGITGPDFGLYAGTSMTMPLFYAYDKAGMVGLTRHLAVQLGPHGIRVNCLAPGGLADGTQPASFVERYCARTPLGRLATESDVTGALLLLVSDAGAYITGVTLPVDGGFTAH